MRSIKNADDEVEMQTRAPAYCNAGIPGFLCFSALRMHHEQFYRMLYPVIVYRCGRGNVNRKALIDGKRKPSYNYFKYLDMQHIPGRFRGERCKRNSRYVGGFLSPVRAFMFLDIVAGKGDGDGKKNVLRRVNRYKTPDP